MRIQATADAVRMAPVRSSTNTKMEEVMTLASEGLTNGEITINESTLTKIGNAIKKFFGLNNNGLVIIAAFGSLVLATQYHPSS